MWESHPVAVGATIDPSLSVKLPTAVDPLPPVTREGHALRVDLINASIL